MPPERFSWDRKDLRKYDRSTPRWRESSSSHYGSKYDRSTPRWRESSSSHYGSSRDFSHWGGPNEFRRPPGHGKQGGWHMFAEESGHGYAPFRSSDRILDDKNFRPTVARGDSKYGRNGRDQASFGQRDWRAHSWDMSDVSSNTSGRLHDLSNDQRSVDDMLSFPTSHAQPEFSITWDQLHSKEQHVNDKSNGVLEAGQKIDGETTLDWKPLKWARSISLSSWGSGLSNSSCLKSLGGADSNEGKDEMPVKNPSLVTSPSGGATTSETSALSEEMSARKKPRLNWGEGLAKYEKKKVEDPEVNVDKYGAVISGGNKEAIHTECLNLVYNSPRAVGLLKCASPATPSSVACSSPGPEEKSFGKAITVDNDTIYLCGSPPSTGSQSHKERFAFNLDVLDGTSLANLLVELLQYDDSSVDSSFVRPIVMNKLHILKDSISKTLEVTESDIDSLENELKSIKFESRSRCPCSAVSCYFPVEDNLKLSSEQVVVSNNIPIPSQLQVSCRVEHVEKVPVFDNVLEENCSNDDVDSPGTATSKFDEPVSLVKAASSLCDSVNPYGYSGDTNVLCTSSVVSRSLMRRTNEEGSSVPSCRDVNILIESKEGASVSGDLSNADNNLCSMILAANNESASRASEVFNYLSPTDLCKVDFSEISKGALQKADATVREKIVSMKKIIKFKERVVTLKFKAFHHLWKEDMRLLSIRKYRAKLQKKYESSLRTTQCAIQKNRSSIRLRFSCPVGNLCLVPTTEMLNFTSKLLSESQVKLYRNDLKMPALVLDKKERRNSQFISRNGIVEDPWAVEKERAMINPWTSQEREIFIDKLATFGKDFQKIASFLDHKTTADCVEFYYKNHKSDCFEKSKKSKQGKSSTNYLVASGRNRKREMNAVSLDDVLGAASFMKADASSGMEKQQMLPGIVHITAGYYDSRKSCDDGVKLDQSRDFDMLENERETVAADILAGICGTISSEAMGSCISTSLNPVDWKSQKVNSISDVSEETCSDDSCGEMDATDWTDEEKSVFVQAVSSYGKDFAMISQCVRTRSRDQCKVFFSKARKCLGLDSINTGYGNSDDANRGGSDAEDGCALDSVGNLHLPVSVEKLDVIKNSLASDLNRSEGYNVAGLPDGEESKEEKTSDSCLTESKLNSPFDCGSKTINGFNCRSEFVQAQEISNESVCSEARREKSTEDGISAGKAIHVSEAVGCCSSNSDVMQVKEDVVSYGSCGACLEGKQLFFHECSLNSHMHDSEATKIMASDKDCHLQAQSPANCSESSQILRGYPPQIPAYRENGPVSGELVSERNVANQFLSQSCHLQKCNNKLKAEMPLVSEQSNKQVNGESRSSSSDSVKPCSNGDVKLFGKILSKPSSSLPKPNNPLEKMERGVHCVNPPGSKSQNLKQPPDGSSCVDHNNNNLLALENVPVKSYGFWDGKKIQTGFSSIPEYFLSKYPEAFANYQGSSSSSKMQAAGSGAQDLSNGLVDNQMMYRRRGVESSPYSVEVKQRQDGIQRNGFEEKGREMVGMGVGGGGGIAVSDPVAVLKLHYAKTEQYGSVMREEDQPWRRSRGGGGADIGR